eukprot:jgi/Undpi1/5484/HiC_scaffold_2.g00763.m1
MRGFHTDSLYFLGLLKLYGISVSPDAGKALECIRKAAELRHLEAMAALGVMLLHGRGCTTRGKESVTSISTRQTSGSIVRPPRATRKASTT